jgi:hypothetical protein
LNRFKDRKTMCIGGEPKCGTKDKRGREVQLEGIGVFGMEGCRKSSCLGGKASTFVYSNVK